MDIIAHGLWGGAAFCRRRWRKFFAAVLIGMAPDLLSFGVFHAMNPSWITMRLAGEVSGPPALAILPPYLFHAYNITHSLVVWGALFGLLWLAKKTPPWLLSAGILHIICDIPTHTESYFRRRFCAISYALREWDSMVNALVHDGELRGDHLRVCRDAFLLSQ